MDKEERRQGAGTGLLVGDALGASYEFMSPEQIPPPPYHMVGGGWLDLAPGEGTDDTALFLCVLAGYQGSDLSLELVKQGMLAWLNGSPKDIGNQTRRALAFHQAHPAALELPEDPMALGNGAVMRAAAHGIQSESPLGAADNAWREAGLTHPSVLARASSALVAELVAWLIQGTPAPEALATALRNLESRDPRAAQELIPLGQFSPSSSGHTVYTTRLALHALLEASDFETGLSQVIALGGDADTNAAVAGALLGARFGNQNIPERWRAQLKSGLPL